MAISTPVIDTAFSVLHTPSFQGPRNASEHAPKLTVSSSSGLKVLDPKYRIWDSAMS